MQNNRIELKFLIFQIKLIFKLTKDCFWFEKILKSFREKKCSFNKQLMVWYHQLLTAVKYLHDNDIVHKHIDKR
jgi:hypothetical protein